MWFSNNESSIKMNNYNPLYLDFLKCLRSPWARRQEDLAQEFSGPHPGRWWGCTWLRTWPARWGWQTQGWALSLGPQTQTPRTRSHKESRLSRSLHRSALPPGRGYKAVLLSQSWPWHDSCTSRAFFPSPPLLPLTHLCKFHLKVVTVVDAGVKVRDLLCRRLDLEDDHDIGEDNNDSGEDEAEDEDGDDEGLAGHRGLCQPPVQRAGRPEGLRGVVSPANQGHGGPKRCIRPHKCQAQEDVVTFEPCAWEGKKRGKGWWTSDEIGHTKHI